jgi:hypothetical protein
VDCNPTEDKPDDEETVVKITGSGANEALLICRTLGASQKTQGRQQRQQ